ncbi:MAG: hypothetical protein V4693_11910 [Pseudomonadota bacterium]
MATRLNKAATAAVLAMAAMLAGCAQTSYRQDSGNGAPGEAVRSTLAAQVVDPAAGLKPKLVEKMDGPSARAATQRYEQPPEASNGPAITILGTMK